MSLVKSYSAFSKIILFQRKIGCKNIATFHRILKDKKKIYFQTLIALIWYSRIHFRRFLGQNFRLAENISSNLIESMQKTKETTYLHNITGYISKLSAKLNSAYFFYAMLWCDREHWSSTKLSASVSGAQTIVVVNILLCPSVKGIQIWTRCFDDFCSDVRLTNQSQKNPFP